MGQEQIEQEQDRIERMKRALEVFSEIAPDLPLSCVIKHGDAYPAFHDFDKIVDAFDARAQVRIERGSSVIYRIADIPLGNGRVIRIYDVTSNPGEFGCRQVGTKTIKKKLKKPTAWEVVEEEVEVPIWECGEGKKFMVSEVENDTEAENSC